MKMIQLTRNPYFGNLINVSIYFQRTLGTNEIVRG